MNSYVPPYDGTAGTVPNGEAVAALFFTLAAVYLVFMMFGAFIIRVPADDWRPDGFDLSSAKKKDRKSTRLNSSHANISYAAFCLKRNYVVSLFVRDNPIVSHTISL